MSQIAIYALGFCLLAAPPADADKLLAGAWWINGNGSYGELSIEFQDDEVRGTIYGQPILGSFDARTGRLAFTRLRDRQDKHGIQEWTGTFSRVSSKRPPTYSLNGTFRSIGGAEFGQPGTDYTWGGTVVRHPAPAEDLRSLRGRWEVARIIASYDIQNTLPDVLGLNKLNALIDVDGNQFCGQGGLVATLANDVSSQSLADEVGLSGFRLVILTLPTGQGLLCSYLLTDEGLELAYPNTTACHRGSGQIIYLRRPAVEQPATVEQPAEK